MNRRTMLIGGVVLLVVVTALVAAFAGGGNDPEEGETIAFGDVTVTGDGLPPLEDPANDPAIGMPAPTLQGEDLEGQPLTIEPGGGPSVLIFLAHWCPHCQAEVPRIQDWIDETGGHPDVELYSVATGTEPTAPNYPPGEWLAREGWSAPVLVDDQAGTAAQAYGLTAFPYWVVLGPEGEVALRLTGELDRNGIEQLFDAAANLGQPG